MRISDWSSDVCSSDLTLVSPRLGGDMSVALGHSLAQLPPVRSLLVEQLEQRRGQTGAHRGIPQHPQQGLTVARHHQPELAQHATAPIAGVQNFSLARKSVAQGKSMSNQEELGAR